MVLVVAADAARAGHGAVGQTSRAVKRKPDIRIPEGWSDFWAPVMPRQNDSESPGKPPNKEVVLRDLEPIEVRASGTNRP